MRGEVLDAIATIEEFARFTVDKTDLAFLDIHIVKSLVDDDGLLHTRQF